MESKSCFGFLPLDKDENTLDESAKKYGCYKCNQRYNCLCLSSIITGTSDNKNVDELINSVKIDQKRKIFDESMRKKFNELKKKLWNNQEDYYNEIDSLFINEIDKKENEDLKNFYISYLKANYSIIKEIKRKMEEAMIKLGVNYDE